MQRRDSLNSLFAPGIVSQLSAHQPDIVFESTVQSIQPHSDNVPIFCIKTDSMGDDVGERGAIGENALRNNLTRSAANMASSTPSNSTASARPGRGSMSTRRTLFPSGES